MVAEDAAKVAARGIWEEAKATTEDNPKLVLKMTPSCERICFSLENNVKTMTRWWAVMVEADPDHQTLLWKASLELVGADDLRQALLVNSKTQNIKSLQNYWIPFYVVLNRWGCVLCHGETFRATHVRGKNSCFFTSLKGLKISLLSFRCESVVSTHRRNTEALPLLPDAVSSLFSFYQNCTNGRGERAS